MKRVSNYERLHAALVAAQAHRSPDAAFVDGEIEWVTYERRVMVDEVNRLRALVGMPAVQVDEVMGAEQSACGHFDYTKKYALGCADLTMMERDQG